MWWEGKTRSWSIRLCFHHDGKHLKLRFFLKSIIMCGGCSGLLAALGFNSHWQLFHGAIHNFVVLLIIPENLAHFASNSPHYLPSGRPWVPDTRRSPRALHTAVATPTAISQLQATKWICGVANSYHGEGHGNHSFTFEISLRSPLILITWRTEYRLALPLTFLERSLAVRQGLPLLMPMAFEYQIIISIFQVKYRGEDVDWYKLAVEIRPFDVLNIQKRE